LGDFARDHHPLCGALPPDIGSSVARIMKDRTNKLLRWPLPHQPSGRALTLVDGQFQAPLVEPKTGLADAAQATTDLQDLRDGVWHPSIGIFDDLPTSVADVPGRQQADQFPATGFASVPCCRRRWSTVSSATLIVALMPNTRWSSSVLTS